jgi:uncharacterized protein YjiS (DUF1127 family)
MIDHIKNIRLTNQSSTPIFRASGKSGGQFGWLRARSEVTVAFLSDKEEAMTVAEIFQPAAQPLARTIAAFAGIVALRLRQLVRVHKNRNEAAVLAAFDDRMLADIGLTRSDLRDAMSAPPWHDPSNLLRARALERRLNRHRFSFGRQEPRVAAPPLAPTDGVSPPPRFPV